MKQVTRSAPIAKRGIRTTQDFAELMSALMSDIIEERIPPDIANATVKAGQQMLKVVEMQIKYGEINPGAKRRNLALLTEGAKSQDELPEIAETTTLPLNKHMLSLVDQEKEFNSWCELKGYGFIEHTDPKFPDMMDEFLDEKEGLNEE